jgi:hypothetical protein
MCVPQRRCAATKRHALAQRCPRVKADVGMRQKALRQGTCFVEDTEKNKQRRRMGAPARAYNYHIASWAVDQGCKQPLIQFVAERASMLVSAALRVNCQSGDSCVGDRKRIIHSMYAPPGETLTLRTVFFLHRRWRRSSEFHSQDSNSVAHQTRRLCTADLSVCRAAPNTSSAAW